MTWMKRNERAGKTPEERFFAVFSIHYREQSGDEDIEYALLTLEVFVRLGNFAKAVIAAEKQVKREMQSTNEKSIARRKGLWKRWHKHESTFTDAMQLAKDMNRVKGKSVCFLECQNKRKS